MSAVRVADGMAKWGWKVYRVQRATSRRIIIEIMKVPSGANTMALTNAWHTWYIAPETAVAAFMVTLAEAKKASGK